MSKKINIPPKPSNASDRTYAESWVTSRQPEKEPTTRLTVDLPKSLHSRVKAACAMRGTPIREEIIRLLEGEFPAA